MSTVYEELLEWSKTIPRWQQDALRRLVGGRLSDQDIRELKLLCLAECGDTAADSEELGVEPLDRKHLPFAKNGSTNVVLTAIHSVKNVNLLDPASTLGFASKGLTVVYGDNGSGKSGYTRILKKLCRARDAGGPIHPNIFQEPSGVPATAVIEFLADTSSEPLKYGWTDGQGDTPNDLYRVSVFDTYCADIYVTKDNNIAYRPFGLDLFDKLADTAGTIKNELDQEKQRLPSSLPAIPESIRDTEVVRQLFPLSSNTKLDELRSLAKWTGDDSKDQQRLKRVVSEDNPVSKAAAVRARKEVIDQLRRQMEAINSALSAEHLKTMRQHQQDLAGAREAARIASEEAFGQCLPGTGADPWKQLWEHAREYSEGTAYPSATFPNTEDGAVCVLCQQTLTDDAKKRLNVFRDFIDREAARNLEARKRITEDDRKCLAELITTGDSDRVFYEVLTVHSGELRDALVGFLQTATQAKSNAIAAITSGDWTNTAACHFDVSPLLTIVEALGTEAKSVEATLDVASLERNRKRLLELDAKSWLHTNLASLEQEVTQHKRVALIDAAIRKTSTSAITRKASDLANEYVTEPLQKAIKDELTNINAGDLRISITRRGEKGKALHHIDIEGKKIPDSQVKDIVSEGEYRAVALAAFFAELSQSPDKSAIVVDDPVCSLDHIHRDRVARRLVDEAIVRQVIVLTHDMVFLDDLIRKAEEEEACCKLCYVSRAGGNVGVVQDGLPWLGMRVKERANELMNQLSSIQALYDKDKDDPMCTSAVTTWYKDLRVTWERSVEEIVLNGVVVRFSRDIQTQRLQRVTELTSDDYKAIDKGMSRCSDCFGGHDESPAVNATVPTPAEMRRDLEDFQRFCKGLLDRGFQPRKAIRVKTSLEKQ